MGTLSKNLYVSLRFLLFAGMVIMSISVHVQANDDSQNGDDGEGEDTAFARSSISSIRI